MQLDLEQLRNILGDTEDVIDQSCLHQIYLSTLGLISYDTKMGMVYMSRFWTRADYLYEGITEAIR